MSRIIHFTTVHPRNDTRIHLKEVRTLAKRWPGEVALFVQDGKGPESYEDQGYEIYDTGPPEKGRLRRMVFGARRMYHAVRRAKPTIVHFHDPELLPWAFLLRLSGVKVIYDVHENAPATVLSKTYLNPFIRRPMALILHALEKGAKAAFSAIVAATIDIRDNFGSSTTLVQNFPMLGELRRPNSSRHCERPKDFAYVGGVTAIRSAHEIVDALDVLGNPEVRLQMAGAFAPKTLEMAVTSQEGWRYVTFHGWAGRDVVSDIMGNVRAGLVLFHPLPNHITAQPNKLFEYMSAGLPVIASDFPLWREIVQKAGSGLLVDPEDPKAIAGAMQWILDNTEEAEAMGQRGCEAVECHYNWDAEAAKLVALYEDLLKEKKGQ